MHPLLLLSATRLAEQIRTRAVSSVEVVETHIEHLSRVNPNLNAVVATRFDMARQQAQQVDEQIKNNASDLPPFAGVPCTIKECLALDGMPNSSGLMSRKNIIASANATVVDRILNAGAIPLGVTNTSELCMWMETHNRVYGRTNNPYDSARVVGGSSGGEGAIVGSGASPFGIGSDVGGSIRTPAFFNGVFGHKPTGGLVPGTGQYPIAEGAALRYLTTGPICRRAEDLYPLLKLLAGPDGQDTGCYEMPLLDPSKITMGSLRVFDVHDGLVPVSKDLLTAQECAAHHLQSRGASVSKASIPALKDGAAIWSALMTVAGGKPYRELLSSGRSFSGPLEVAKWIVGRSAHTLPSIGLAILEEVPKLVGDTSQRFVEVGRELKAQLIEMLGNNGVMLYPTYPTTAPKHYKPLLPPWYWTFPPVFNVLEFPVTQVPLGLDEEGLPMGCQVVAAPGNDHLTLAVAIELEKAFGGWIPPRPRVIDKTQKSTRRVPDAHRRAVAKHAQR